MIQLEIFYPSGNSVITSARSTREAETKAEKALSRNASHVTITGDGHDETLTIEDFSDHQPVNFPTGFDFIEDSPAYRDFMADAA
jgi:hypothetical protein